MNGIARDIQCCAALVNIEIYTKDIFYKYCTKGSEQETRIESNCMFTRDLACTISFFNWFASYLLVMDPTVELEEEELMLLCLACVVFSWCSLTLSSSDVQYCT